MGHVTAIALPDWGFVLLRHDGEAWLLDHQDGRTLYRNPDIDAADAATARGWAGDLIVELADVTPADMGRDADMWGLQRRDQAVEAAPIGGMRHDGVGWALVDGLGRVSHRNDDLGPDEHDDAVLWVDGVYRSLDGRPRRWRMNVGVFPDGSYCDPHRLLGRQRTRRAWNRLLDLLRIG